MNASPVHMVMFLKAKWIGAIKRLNVKKPIDKVFNILLDYWHVYPNDSHYELFHKICCEKLSLLERNIISEFFKNYQ